MSRSLGSTFAKQWLQLNPNGKVIERDLTKTDLPFVELPWIIATRTEPDAQDAEQRAALAIGDSLIAELKSANEWLITTPMYNFAIPARLKAYIDHIVRADQTFSRTAESFTGLLTGKKATVIFASAGEYDPSSPLAAYDHLSPYLKMILALIGVTEVTFVQAGSTWKVDRGITDSETFLTSICGQHPMLASVGGSRFDERLPSRPSHGGEIFAQVHREFAPASSDELVDPLQRNSQAPESRWIDHQGRQHRWA